MKFSLASAFALACYASTAASATNETREGQLPETYYLSSSTGGLGDLIWNALMYANGSAYIGNIKYTIDSEPLYLSGGSFTSFHSSPTGWQNLYVYQNASRPVGFTTPHSSRIPDGATIEGLGVSRDGRFTWGGEQRWKACPADVPEYVGDGTFRIYWEGGQELGDCVGVTLEVKEKTCHAEGWDW